MISVVKNYGKPFILRVSMAINEFLKKVVAIAEAEGLHVDTPLLHAAITIKPLGKPVHMSDETYDQVCTRLSEILTQYFQELDDQAEGIANDGWIGINQLTEDDLLDEFENSAHIDSADSASDDAILYNKAAAEIELHKVIDE